MQFRIAKRRKSFLDEPIIPSRKRLNLKYHVGGSTRKFFRYIFEHKAIKKILGTNIAFMLVTSSFVPTLASNDSKVLGTNIIKTEIPLSTTISIQNPVKIMRVTQPYKFLHPGLDLDGKHRRYY